MVTQSRGSVPWCQKKRSKCNVRYNTRVQRQISLNLPDFILIPRKEPRPERRFTRLSLCTPVEVCRLMKVILFNFRSRNWLRPAHSVVSVICMMLILRGLCGGTSGSVCIWSGMPFAIQKANTSYAVLEVISRPKAIEAENRWINNGSRFL